MLQSPVCLTCFLGIIIISVAGVGTLAERIFNTRPPSFENGTTHQPAASTPPVSQPHNNPQSDETPPPWFDGITLFDAIQMGNWDAFLFRLAVAGDNITSTDPHGATPLHYAADHGELAMLQHLVEKLGGAADIINNISSVDGNQWTPLHYACRSCHPQAIKYLVEAGGAHPVDSKDDQNRTPLLIAVQSDCSQPIKYLVEHGAEVNTQSDDDGESPLHRSIRNEHLPTVVALVEAGADLESKNHHDHGLSPLHYSVSLCGRLSLLQYLVDKNADVNSKNNDKGNSPLHTAVQNDCPLPLVQLLVESGADLSSKNIHDLTPQEMGVVGSPVYEYLEEKAFQNSSQFTTTTTTTTDVPVNMSDIIQPAQQNNYKYFTLFEAVRLGDLEAVRFRLAAGDSVSAENYGGFQPIHVAVEQGHLDVVKYLVEEVGVDPGSRNELLGTSTLHLAADLKSADLLKYLVGKKGGNNVSSVVDNYGITPLHRAARSNYLESLKYLIQVGGSTSLNATDNRKRTPLHWAAGRCSYHLVYFLVEEAGAPLLDALDDEGHSPFSSASSCEHKDPLKLLKYLFRNESDDVKRKDSKGNTPLHLVATAYSPRFPTVQFLVEKGAELNAQNWDGNTPLHILAGRSSSGPTTTDVNIIKYLVDRGADLELSNYYGKRAADLSSNEEIKALLTPKN